MNVKNKKWREISASVFSDQTDHKTNDGHDRKNKEKNFGNFNGTSSNTTKAEYGSDQCDDQKNNRVMKHHNLPDVNGPEVNQIEK